MVAPAASDFETFFRDVFPRLRGHAMRFGLSPAAAEDAAAEACARALAGWGRVSGLAYREAWVTRVCCNVAIDEVRSTTRHPRRSVGAITDDRLEQDTADRLELTSALARLPRRQREAVVLRHLVGLTEADVSDVLQLSRNTVKTHTDRGLATLRVQFATLIEEVASHV